MTARIVDHKKLDMTDDEFKLYQKIVKSYTHQNNKGEDLFQGLFEVDKDGVIMFLIPPSKRQISLEVWCFLMALQQQQHIRVMYDQNLAWKNEMLKKFDELKITK